MALPTTFHIKRVDTLMATLDRCEPSEMFWQTCRFMPTAAFEEVRPFFEAVTFADDDESLDVALEAFEPLGLVLVDVESGYTTPDFFLHVHGDSAELRFA